MPAVLREFELEVLLAILRIGEPTYSVPLVAELEQRLGRRVPQAAVFIALSRLEKKGLLTSRLDESGADTGRVRRYFKPTAAAVKELRRTRDAHARLWAGADALLRKR